MIRLTKHQVIQMHKELLSYTGGTAGVRDENLLESALAAPFMMFSGTELFPSLEEKAARLCYGLVKNHAMVDGNKRIGVHTSSWTSSTACAVPRPRGCPRHPALRSLANGGGVPSGEAGGAAV